MPCEGQTPVPLHVGKCVTLSSNCSLGGGSCGDCRMRQLCLRGSQILNWPPWMSWGTWQEAPSPPNLSPPVRRSTWWRRQNDRMTIMRVGHID